jgi:alpha-tubulin suppressor-like RCC1 family protein
MRLSIVPVKVLAGIALAIGGVTHTGTTTAGTVSTWGNKTSSGPVEVQGLPQAVDIQAANWGGLIVDAGGNVWQWNESGKPKAVEELRSEGVTSIGEGYWFSAAIDSSGNVWTWGKDGDGDLCQGAVSGNVTTPTRTSITDASVVTGGANHLAILLDNGKVLSCGDNGSGQLGDGSSEDQSDTPVYALIGNVTELSSGDTTDVALEGNGTVWAWGQGNFGQLGDGETSNSNTPEQVELPGSASEVYAGGDEKKNGSEIALLKNGSVWAWGYDRDGELGPDGNGSVDSTPVQVPFPNDTAITWVGIEGQTGFALDSQGRLWAWGSDSKGQYGNGATSSSTPGIVDQDCSKVSVVAAKVVAICSN